MGYSILTTGDLVIDNPYDILNIDENVIHLFKQSDLNIVNLEAPVTSSIAKILKTGPHLKADKKSTLQVLNALNIHAVTIANNHILDYDEKGLEDTLEFCYENNIRPIGAGMNLKEASKTVFINSPEGKVAFINFAENEWSSANENKAGANPMDIINNLEQIKEAKKNADFIFIIIHGGNEYNHYPSPRMVKQYRFYAANGANAVIGHHTHCVSGYEKYKGVPIFYSLGNFLFTTNKKKLDSWYTGLVLKWNIQRGNELAFEIIPVNQTKGSHSLSLSQVNQKNEVFNLIKEVNKVISNEQLLNEKWKAFVQEVEGGFIKSLTPIAGIKNRYIKAAFYRSKLYKIFLHETYIKEHLNRIRCESHYDVTNEFLNKYLNNHFKGRY